MTHQIKGNQININFIWFDSINVKCISIYFSFFLSFLSIQSNQSIKIRSINQLASAERWKRDKWKLQSTKSNQSKLTINQINQPTNQLMLFWFYFHQSFTIDSWFHLTSNNQSLIKYQSSQWVNERKKKWDLKIITKSINPKFNQLTNQPTNQIKESK